MNSRKLHTRPPILQVSTLCISGEAFISMQCAGTI